jgi:hypothetical protein
MPFPFGDDREAARIKQALEFVALRSFSHSEIPGCPLHYRVLFNTRDDSIELVSVGPWSLPELPRVQSHHGLVQGFRCFGTDLSNPVATAPTPIPLNDQQIAKIQVRDFGTTVEVSAGVKDGDQVILNPPVDLTDGHKVKVLPRPHAQLS